MGSLGLPELAFIFILALLIFGPKKLPELGRTVGKAMSEFRRATSDLKRTINTELALEENPVPQPLRPRRVDEGALARSEADPAVAPPGLAPASTEARGASPYPRPEPTEPRSSGQ